MIFLAIYKPPPLISSSFIPCELPDGFEQQTVIRNLLLNRKELAKPLYMKKLRLVHSFPTPYNLHHSDKRFKIYRKTIDCLRRRSPARAGEEGPLSRDREVALPGSLASASATTRSPAPGEEGGSRGARREEGAAGGRRRSLARVSGRRW